MNIFRLFSQGSRDLRQRQIMRGHEADRAVAYKPANHCFGANPAVVRVGTAQNLIDQKQQVAVAGRQIDQLSETRDLRVKARLLPS